MRAKQSRKRSSQPRRTASRRITDAALNYQHQRLHALTRSAAKRLTNLKGEEKLKWAAQIFLDTERKAGLAALAWLREFNVPIYQSCIHSAMNFAKISLCIGETAEFKFLTSKEVNTQRRSLFLPYCLEIYSLLVKDLKAAWGKRVEGKALGRGYGHIVSKKGRFGVAQQAGLRRHAAQIKAKTAAVLDIATKYFVDASMTRPPLPEITEQLAQKWVREIKTPSRIAIQILSHYTGRKPRTIKALLIKARKIPKLPA